MITQPSLMLAVIAALAGLAAVGPARAGDIRPNFDLDWSGTHVPAEARSLVPPERAVLAKSGRPQMRFGPNSVSATAVGGKPGAEINPDNSNMSLGLGFAPAGRNDTIDINGDLTGALQLTLDDGPLTPSMTLRGPFPGAGGSGASGDVRTIFGLGLKF